ncbi:MAG: hypothetical protein WBA41_33255, partial [Rivularia sp. (in: cyanobacteria)]
TFPSTPYSFQTNSPQRGWKRFICVVVGWVERSETQHYQPFVGLCSSTQPTIFVIFGCFVEMMFFDEVVGTTPNTGRRSSATSLHW